MGVAEVTLGAKVQRGSGVSPWSGVPGGRAPDATRAISLQLPPPAGPLLTLSVKMTPNFQIWYLMSMDMSLCGRGGEGWPDARGLEPGQGPARPRPAWGCPGSPGKQPGRGFRLALIVDGDLQRSQVHAQQFGDPLPPIDVPVLVQNLHRRAWGHADTA